MSLLLDRNKLRVIHGGFYTGNTELVVVDGREITKKCKPYELVYCGKCNCYYHVKGEPGSNMARKDAKGVLRCCEGHDLTPRGSAK